MQHRPSATVGTLEVPDARLHYEVRGQGPLVVLVAAPMDASSFAPLADLLAPDHTVLTTDPRGINRSPVADPARDSTPELRADDLSRLLAHLDAGPAAVLGLQRRRRQRPGPRPGPSRAGGQRDRPRTAAAGAARRP